MPTTSLMPLPKQQYLSSIGTPLANGRVYTYAAGTSTPKQTFSDSAGTIPQPNPIILNARGEPQNPIYWSGNYRVVVQDALGNTIYTVDNYNTDPAGLWNIFSTLLSNSGSSLIGFIQSGAGAIKRTIQDKLRDSVASVIDYGADPTGTNDSTAAFSKAWSYSKNNFIPPGTYKVSSLPNWAKNGAKIQTEGTVIINYVGSDKGIIVDAGTTDTVSDIYIGPMTITGNPSATFGMYIRGVVHSKFDRIRPINFSSASLLCEFMVSNTFYDFCYSGNEPNITVNTVNGILLRKRGSGEQCSNCTFINPIIEGTSGNGIVLEEAVMNTFLGGTSEGNGHGGGAGGVVVGPNSIDNVFISLDMEFNGKLGDSTSFHVNDSGVRTLWLNPFCDSILSSLFWNTGAVGQKVIGGQIADWKIESGAKSTLSSGLSYLGTITDNGSDSHHINLYNINTATTIIDSNVSSGSWSPIATNLAGPGTPIYNATYTKSGNSCSFTIYITSTGGSVTSTAASTTFSLPFPVGPSRGVGVAASNNTAQGLGQCLISGGNLCYTPNFTDSAVVISGTYTTT